MRHPFRRARRPIPLGYALGFLLFSGGAHAAPEPVVKTQSGAVSGAETNGVEAFRALPYAKPPVGDLR